MDVCPVCKTPYPNATSTFCAKCGMERPKKIPCPQCGILLEPDARCCYSCKARTEFGRKADEALGLE